MAQISVNCFMYFLVLDFSISATLHTASANVTYFKWLHILATLNMPLKPV